MPARQRRAVAGARPRSSPPAGASSRSCAPPASTRSRTSSRASSRSPRRGGPRRSRARRRDRDARARRRPPGRQARPGQGRVRRPRRPLRADPAARRGSTCSARRPSSACARSTSATSWAPTARSSARAPGELTVSLDGVTLLAKSLRPPPEKHHGLTDTETRFRRRELDLMANEESRELFVARARIITEIRRFLDEHGFVEVETPILQTLYGGAAAKPFVDPPQRARPRPCTCGSPPSSTSSG